ncbi:CBS domain-containing protein [Cryptosporangium minutisporangium]|uniref:CBS domain-containing protein n=1 Tax=Cryptosporangium minutisporangium TaxID=113569 RepID=A0ABP6T756_9ACTN
MRHRTVRDVMTTDVVTVRVGTPAKDVAEQLDRHRISGVPVLDEAGHVAGVVTATDLLHKITYQEDGDEWPRFLRRHRVDREKAHGTTANDLMTSPATTIGPDASIVEAATVLESGGVKRLPVVDVVGALVGIVSRADLVKVFTRPDHQIRDEIVTDVVERALLLPPAAITVDVTEGVVTLRGHLERRSEAVLAAALARRVDGVVRVVDELGYLNDDTRYVYA